MRRWPTVLRCKAWTLQGNQLTDLSPLVGLSRLTEVDLQWNRLNVDAGSPTLVLLDSWTAGGVSVQQGDQWQTISFTLPASVAANSPPLTLSATASSGLPVTFSVISGPASLNGNQLSFTGPGVATVQASQAGNGAYLPDSAQQTIVIGGPPPVSAQALPPVFVDIDLGSPSAPGSVVTNSDGSLSITGNGADIWNAGDQCNYFYTWAVGQQWAAAFKVDADIVGGDPTWAKCELMVRESSISAGPQQSDAYIAMMYTKPDGADWLADQYRSVAGGLADWYHPTQPAYQPLVWMGIVRDESVFSLYYSLDGTNWTDYLDIDTSTNAFVGNDWGTSFGTAWPQTVAVGIAVTSHDNTPTNSATAKVSDLQVTFPGVTPPTATGASVEPENVTNYAGCEATFTFVATNNAVIAAADGFLASPPLETYQWYMNGSPIAGATGSFLYPPD